MATRLSININKIALLRNARGSNFPNLLQVAQDCEAFGAQGITVHPRPDERHVRYADIPALRPLLATEFNIEGNPDRFFLDLVLAHPPAQCTLVPDDPTQLTSDHGWDTLRHAAFLRDTIQQLHEKNIRVSLFIDPVEKMIEGAKAVGADRIEYYTGPYAHTYSSDPAQAIAAYRRTAPLATQLGLGINAGHDLNLHNLTYFQQHIPGLLEVSIGHALVVDALYYGLQNTIQLYLQRLNQ